MFRLARAWEQRREAKEALWARLFTPAAKFAICKQGIPFVAEAMEVLGGMGYCEESELPRLYREMPVNSIWEGSGNIMCLDVLRVLTKQHGVYDVLSEVLRKSKVRIAITTARYVSYSNVYANRMKQWAERLRSSFSCWDAGGNASSCLAAAGAGVVSDDAGYTRRNAAVCQYNMIYC